MDLTQFDVHLGNFIDGDPMDWPIFMEGNNKLVLIGEDEKRNRAFDNIEKQLLELDNIVYFKINCDGSRKLESNFTISNITFFEESVPEKAIPNQLFASHRKDFVNIFMKLMLEKIGVDRSELAVSYRPTQEGPLQGYIKAANGLVEQKRDDFKEYIQSLDNIVWEVEGDLLQFRVNGDGVTEKHLELLKGIWSFWVFTMNTSPESVRVVHVAIPDISLYNEEQLTELNIMLGILEDLANMTNTVLILTTNCITPIKPLSIRYKLMVNNCGSDYSFTDGHPLEFDDSDDLFMVIDDVLKKKLIGKFNF